MGRFLLCVESNVREVNSLLTFHNVHPQVRADVQRRLQRLLYRVQEYVGTLVPGYCESAESVCAAVVQEIIDTTFRNVIPGVELTLEEKRSAAFEQRAKDLELELQMREKRCRALEGTLDRFRKAHHFMLRSYFREVLVLRYQLHDALWKRRRSQARLLQLRHMVAAQPGEPPARTTSLAVSDYGALAAAEEQAASLTSENLSLSDVSTDEPETSGNIKVVGVKDDQVFSGRASLEGIMPLPPPPQQQQQLKRAGTKEESKTMAKTPPSKPKLLEDLAALKAIAVKRTPPTTTLTATTTATEGADAAAASVTIGTENISAAELTMRRKSSSSSVALLQASPLVAETARKLKSTSLVKKKRKRRESLSGKVGSEKKFVETKTASTQTTPIMGDDSVDAIFDYERYICQLNQRQRKGNDSLTDAEMTRLSLERLALERYRRQQASGLQLMNQQLLNARENAATAAWKHRAKKNSDSFSSAVSQRTAMILQPFKEMLLEELGDIYRNMQRLQEKHGNDMLLLKNALDTLESRVNFVLDFFGTYADEVSLLAAALLCDGDMANSSMLNDGMLSDEDLYRRRVVIDYFAPVATTSTKEEICGINPEEEKEESNNEFEGLVTQHQQREREKHANYWNNHPMTLRARQAFIELQAAALQLQRKGFYRRQRTTTTSGLLPKVLGYNSFSSTLLPGSTKGKASHCGLRAAGDNEEEEGEEEDEDFRREFMALSRAGKLRALVQLRMKRIAYRARHRTRLCQLAEDARKGKKGEYLQRTLAEACSHELTVAKLTEMINWMLRELGLSSTDSVAGRAFFMKNLTFSPYLCEPTGELEDEENEVVYVPLPVDVRHAGDLCATLSSNQPGYVMFNDEVIPIATITYSQSTGHPNTLRSLGRPDEDEADGRGGGGGRGGRRVFPFHGTVIDYCRGVQLGRPLGDKHGPLYVFWDAEQGAFFLVEEDEDGDAVTGEGHSARRSLLQKVRQKSQQSLARQQVQLSTVLFSPALPDARKKETHAYSIPRGFVSDRRVPQEMMLMPPPLPATTRTTTTTHAHDVTVPNLVPPLHEGARGLPPRSPSALVTNRPIRPLVVQPSKEERELLRIESLTARRAPGGAKRNDVTTQSSDNGVTALARLKGVSRRLEREAVAMAQRSPARAVNEEVENRHFLRVRFPEVLITQPPPTE